MEYNVLVATDPISAFVVSAAKKPNTFCVYEDLDYFEDLQPGKVRSLLVSFLEKLALKRADLVISVSEPLLRRASLVNPNCILIPNGVDLKVFPKFMTEFRDSIVVYAGSLVDWTGLEIAIRGFTLLKEKLPNLKMKIIGEGEGRPELEALVRSLSLENIVSFTGKLPYARMAELLCKSSVGLATFKPGRAAAYASPLKLFDYMAAGIPIIATDIGEIGQILRTSGSGFPIKWDINEFVGKIEILMTNQSIWQNFQKNGLQYVKANDWDRLFKKWLEELRSRLETRFVLKK